VERPLSGDEQAPELLMELFESGSRLLIDALPSVWDGSCEAVITPQDAERASKVTERRPNHAPRQAIRKEKKTAFGVGGR